MKEFKYVVKDELGIHARPAGILVKEIAKAASDVKLQKTGDDRVVNAKSIMAVMSLGVKQGNEVVFTADGADEDEVVAKIEKVMTENL
ncbi:MAG TPA: HPr family phosphocarrier protein [Candidatus Bariatricus faecipullorum]|nr:HPr family phosphocarrier protein [Candidatus Bariatricus faecipullorum]